MIKKMKSNYVAHNIRKNMRININKKDELIYKAAKIAKCCVEFGDYGCSIYWDFKQNCWIESESLDMLNTACLVGANMLKCNPKKIYKLVSIIYEMSISEYMLVMPPTREVIKKFKSLKIDKELNYRGRKK